MQDIVKQLPLPPEPLRALVGPTDPAFFDNPTREWAFYDLPTDFDRGYIYRRVLDFGCGCGRNARQLMLQHQPPEEYVGVDVSREMIEWCQRNLTLHDPRFTFRHHDVHSPVYAPTNSSARTRPLEFPPGHFTLTNAHS